MSVEKKLDADDLLWLSVTLLTMYFVYKVRQNCAVAKLLTASVDICRRERQRSRRENKRRQQELQGCVSRGDEATTPSRPGMPSRHGAELQTPHSRTASKRKQIICYRCNKPGHIAKFCPYPRTVFKKVCRRGSVETNSDSDQGEHQHCLLNMAKEAIGPGACTLFGPSGSFLYFVHPLLGYNAPCLGLAVALGCLSQP